MVDNAQENQPFVDIAVDELPDDNQFVGNAQNLMPDREAVNYIWRLIVRTFAIAFILSVIALIAAAFLKGDNIQLLLTVVTTTAGILAGFISGRATSGAGS